MKESQMQNPNSLGHFHRDIVKVIEHKPYYYKLLLSCNHTKWMTIASYKKFKHDATLCMTCSHISDEKEITFDDLYDWLKYCLKFFGLNWAEKDKMIIKFGYDYVEAKYDDETIRRDL